MKKRPLLLGRHSKSEVWGRVNEPPVATGNLLWQQGTWFRVSVVPLALGLVAGTYAWLHHNSAKRGQQLEAIVSERTQALRQSNIALERRHRIAEGMRDVMTALNSNQSLENVLTMIATQAQGLLGAYAVMIGTMDAALDTLSVLAICGPTTDADDAATRATKSTMLKQAIVSGQPIIFADSGGDPEQPSRIGSSPNKHQAVLAVPIAVEAARFQGGMLLSYINRELVTDAESELATLFAAQAALVIENTQLKATAQEMATVLERNRVARELHDSVTQSLYSIILNSDATLLALASGNPDKVELRLHQLKDIAREAMTELRLLIYELRPSILEEQGLLAALNERLEAVETRSGLQVDLQLECDQILPLDVQDELFRVILEGLNNVVKHARASHVKIQMVRQGDCCRLILEDDGCGFDVSTASRYGGYGLKTIRERLQRIGGTLTVRSEPGAGSTLEIEVPI